MNNTAAQTLLPVPALFFENLSIGSLRIDQARYVIPVYQRPYAWTSVQVSQLMQDLLDFCRSPDIQSTYSLGTIVCDEETPGVFSILDGQQRLTTIDSCSRKSAAGSIGRQTRSISESYRLPVPERHGSELRESAASLHRTKGPDCRRAHRIHRASGAAGRFGGADRFSGR